MRRVVKNDKGRSRRASKLSLSTFGAFSAHIGNKEIRLSNRKSRALLAYLALTEGSEQTRERLVGLFWSETEEAKARASLRQALYEIREVFDASGYHGLRTDKLTVSLDHAATDVDFVEILAQANAGRVHPLLLERSRPSDALLEEFEGIDQSFRVWLLAKRQSFHDRVERLLETALRNSDQQLERQRDLASALLNLDPTHEEAARALINSHLSVGDVGAALRVYKALWDLLDEEYDVEPSKQTQELIASAKLAQPEALAPAHKMPAQAKALSIRKPTNGEGDLARPRLDATNSTLVVSIAPFEAVLAPSRQHYLVQGFRRELMACLVRFREWLVRDLNTAGQATARSLADSADEYCIEGSVIPAGDSLRLLLTLKHVSTGLVLWSERLHLRLGDWFDAQQTMVRRLATALNVHVSAERLVAVAPRPNGDLRRYDLWLRGQSLILSFDPQDWHKASDLFREVIKKEPQFAPAYSSLAQLQNTIHFVHPGVFRDPQRTQEAVELARQATRLDPVDSRSHLCLGWAFAMASQHEHAAIHHALAYELNESDPWTLTSVGVGYAFGGQPDRARRLIENASQQASQLNPIHWRYRAIVDHICHDHENCIASANLAASNVPNEIGWKVSALYHAGKHREAKAELNRFYALVSKRWCGSETATRKAMLRWFLHLFPMRLRDDWEHLKEGLSGAGAPVKDLEFETVGLPLKRSLTHTC